MWYEKALERLDGASGGNGILLSAAIIGGVLLLVAVTVACLCKNGGVYAACAAVLVGGLEWVIFVTETAARAATFFRAIAWLAVGAAGLLTVAVIALARRRARRKRWLSATAKGSTDLLPEKDNSYVRARLQTALCADGKGGALQERKSVPYENRGAVRLGYARRLLAGVQDAPLTQAERLETETLARELADYAVCEKWDSEQVRAVNDLFARLLKLGAKYSVEI